MWDLIASVPDHCLSFYFMNRFRIVFQKFSLTKQSALPLYYITMHIILTF